MLVNEVRINENKNSYLFILWEMKIWIWKHKLFKSYNCRSVLTKTSLWKDHISNYFLTTRLVLLFQKLCPQRNKLFHNFNSVPFINGLKCCVGRNGQSFASGGLQSNVWEEGQGCSAASTAGFCQVCHGQNRPTTCQSLIPSRDHTAPLWKHV